MNYNLYDTSLPSWAYNPDPLYSSGVTHDYCCHQSCCCNGYYNGTGVGGSTDVPTTVLPAPAPVTPAVTIPLYDKCGCPLKSIFLPAGFTPVLPATYSTTGVGGATSGGYNYGCGGNWGGSYCGC